jgi:formyl-CoA transferase/CoA:oxalate CoA-transferase
MPELAEDERYLTNALRVEARAELTAMLAEVFVTRTTAEWQEAFNVHHALFGPVHTLSEALEHPHVVQAGLVQTVQHPTAGEIPQLGPVIFLRDTPGRIAGPPPLLGEHTREVLAELGYTDGEIDDMVAAGSAGTYESLSSGDSSQ